MNTQPRVITASEQPLNGPTTFLLAVLVILCAALFGAIVGFGAIGLLRVSVLLTEALWEGVPRALSFSARAPWFILACCIMGGILIGLWNRRIKGSIDLMDQVIAECRATGGYHLKSWLDTLVAFFLPITFGGAIGPEAGITGVIMAGVTWARETTKRVGVAAVRNPRTPLRAAVRALRNHKESPHDDALSYGYSKEISAVLWTAGGLGCVGGILLFNRFIVGGSGIPRVDGIAYSWEILAWVVPLMIVGYLVAQFARGAQVVCERASKALVQRPVLKGVLCGVALGVSALFFYEVLFSGESQLKPLMSDWQNRGALVLVATGLLKLALTQLCIAFGWTGGAFFPMIFSGACLGYGMASLAGIDPLLCVAVITAAIVAGVMRQPLVAILVLALFFAPASLPVIIVVAFVCGKVPALVSQRKEKQETATN